MDQEHGRIFNCFVTFDTKERPNRPP